MTTAAGNVDGLEYLKVFCRKREGRNEGMKKRGVRIGIGQSAGDRGQER